MRELRTNEFTKFIQDNYGEDELKNIAVHGCINEHVAGMVYFDETTAIYDKYKECIWEILEDRAYQLKVTVMQMLTQATDSKGVCNSQTFDNYCVWFAAECVAEQITIAAHTVNDGGESL